MSSTSNYHDIVYSEVEGVAILRINRPENGNKFRVQTALELADAFRHFKSSSHLKVAILTGTGDRFFCIGGEHDPFDTLDYSSVMPIVDVYELIDTIAKPIIAAVNGFAVGGGNVLHTVCDLTIAAESAVFRQVGPLVGSFDAGYGTWYLEEVVGRKRAKEMWYLNRKYSAQEAKSMGLVNDVVPLNELMTYTMSIAQELMERGPLALGGLKSAFSAKHTGVTGQARMAHDQLLTFYLATREAKEVGEAFRQKREANKGEFLH